MVKTVTLISATYFTALEENTGETVLYFGCRHRNKDYLYRKELGNYAVFFRDRPCSCSVLLISVLSWFKEVRILAFFLLF